MPHSADSTVSFVMIARAAMRNKACKKKLGKSEKNEFWWAVLGSNQ
jgi:hypothetical protein